MIYPAHFEEKIEFTKIRELIKQDCISTLGISYVDKMQFLTEYSLLVTFLNQTGEFKDILQANFNFPSTNYIDIQSEITKAGIIGTFLTEEELQRIYLFLGTIEKCLSFFKSTQGEKYIELKKISTGIRIEKKISTTIESILDDKGKIRDNASSELKEIRKTLREKQSSIRKKLEQILKEAKNNEMAPSDASITVRAGRMVIPIFAEYKRKIKGFIHDESASGQTTYIEPTEILDINNEIKELEYEEKREVVKILTAATDEIRPFLSDIKNALQFLGRIDFIRAKAKFAIRTQGIVPTLVKEPILNWKNGFHPLLRITHDKQKKKTIPLSIELDPTNRIIVISGPNAGGKSVCLKTVGLLQYMLQCGIPIPIDEGSRTGIFENIFIDIGDQQSLENDLSTYSSHLTNMNYFLKFSTSKTLILIDEFGTGTDPQFGGAIAEAILLQLNKIKALGVITTHYTNLKIVGEKTPGIVNGAMLFDQTKLEPLYALQIGKPGSSFALEIASKIGLPFDVIDYAKEKIGSSQVDLESLLQKVENEKIKLLEQNEKIKEKEKEVDSTLLTYQELYEELAEQKKNILKEAKLKAQELVAEANQKIEYAIRKIKEKKAEKETTQEVKKDIQEFSKKLIVEDSEKKEKIKNIKNVNQTIEVGDTVRIQNTETTGTVLSIKGKEVEMAIGQLKSTIALNRLEKIESTTEKKSFFKKTVQGIDITQKMATFKPELDIRGKMPSEAMNELEIFIDNAILASAHEVRIVHGKGNGVLKKLVQEYLKKLKYIKQLSYEHADRGGEGVTIAQL